MAFQSLYRRFRPQRFDQVVGQEHLVSVLRNAIVEDKVGHAYLLSGPRGTGKTSTARILAKALNCENLSETGEPCGACGSCQSVEAGNSMDLVELDAASNNRVENVRELITNAALGSPGRRKVYLLDEVHMLSTAASNALLKTLEEPPGHVVFVLATTDPQKVLPTIRSRTQHLELSLIGAEALEAHVRNIGEWADVEVSDEVVEYVVGRGGGSARDTLSALDQVLAAGGIPDDRVSVDRLIEAIASDLLTEALASISAASEAGVDPRDLAERTTRRLRDCFLVMADAAPTSLPASEVTALGELGSRLGRAMTVRALELIGTTLVDMRQAPDPRLTLEVAIVRLLQAESQTDLGALAQRVERLERGGSPGAAAAPPVPGAASGPSAAPSVSGGPPPNDDVGAAAASQPPRPSADEPRPPTRANGPNAARAALAALRGQQESSSQPEPTSGGGAIPPPPPMPAASEPTADVSASPAAAEPVVEPASEPDPVVEHEARTAGDAPGPDLDPEPDPPAPDPVGESVPPAEPVAPPPPVEPAAAPAVGAAGTPELSHGRLNEIWTDRVLARLTGMTKALFTPATFTGVDGDNAVFQVPNQKHRERCEPRLAEVEAVLAAEYGGPVRMRLVDGNEGAIADAPAGPDISRPAPAAPEDHTVDLDALEDAPPDGRSSLDRITDAFPGATIVEDPDGMMGQ